MKKIIICMMALIFGVCVTQAFGQVGVQVQGNSILVQPPTYNVRVYVPQYYHVVPKPYLVTPYWLLPPPKPQFRTPFRDKFWQKKNKPKLYYYVQPLPQKK